MPDPILRRLARDQWVRIHGTPRVTVLVGGDHAREQWTRWAELAEPDAILLTGEIDPQIREAAALAARSPARAVAGSSMRRP
jgi:enterochelin esterase-like enzyme